MEPGRDRSHADDPDQTLQAGEVVRVPRVELQPVGMGGRGDEQVGDASPMRAAALDHGRDQQAIAACRGDIEGNRVEGRLELL